MDKKQKYDCNLLWHYQNTFAYVIIFWVFVPNSTFMEKSILDIIQNNSFSVSQKKESHILYVRNDINNNRTSFLMKASVQFQCLS